MADPSLPSPVRLGKYLLLERLAIGGMAEVFLAKTSGFERLLAIKRVLPQLAAEPDFIEMFCNEARISALLNHPDIVQLFDFGIERDTVYLATELIAGRDVRAVAKRCAQNLVPVPPWLAVHVAAKVSGALDYAHQRLDLDGRPLHIVHRDVSTANVLLGWDGGVKLIDFGVAKSVRRGQHATQTGILKGKLSFMSPEQALGGDIDLRADVYAVGAVLYLLLTGRSHNSGQTDYELMQQALAPKFAPPREHQPELPPALEAVVLKALAADREARFQSAGALRAALLEAMPLASDPEVPRRIAAFLEQQFGAERRDELARHAELLTADTGALPQPPSARHYRSGLVMSLKGGPGQPRIERDGEDELLAGAITEPFGVPGPGAAPADSLAEAATVEVRLDFDAEDDLPSAEAPSGPVVGDFTVGDERRTYTRLPIALEVSHHDGTRLSRTQSRDMSYRGVSLSSAQLLMPGTERQFRLARPDGLLEISFVGEVVNVRAVDAPLPYVTGVRITAMAEDEAARWRALLLERLAALGAGTQRARVRLDTVAFWKSPGSIPAVAGRTLELGFDGARLVLASRAQRADVGLVTITSPADGRLVSVPGTVTASREVAGEWHTRVRFAADHQGQELVHELLRSVLTSPRDLGVTAAPPVGAVRVGSYACKAPTHVGSHVVVFAGVTVSGATGRRVALKRLRTEAVPPALREAFVAESTFLLGLDHPVAAHAYAVMRFGDELWQASEWVDGRSLAQVLAVYGRARRRPPLGAVLSAVAEVGRLLAHRNAMARAVGAPTGRVCVQPSGIVLTRAGQVKVVDFGRLTLAELELKPPSAASWAQVPPEGWGRHDSEAGEVFVLASLLHEALGGAPPFRAGSAAHLAELAKRGPAPLHELNPEVPAALSAVVARALHLKPKKRPQRVTELLSELALAAPLPAHDEGLSARAELVSLKAV